MAMAFQYGIYFLMGKRDVDPDVFENTPNKEFCKDAFFFSTLQFFA